MSDTTKAFDDPFKDLNPFEEYNIEKDNESEAITLAPKKSPIVRFFGHVIYIIMHTLDYVLSYMAKHLPSARRFLLRLIRFVRKFDEEPFDDYGFENNRNYDDLTCPSCNYDMIGLYEDFHSDPTYYSKYIEFGPVRCEYSLDAMHARSWDVKCTCPICKTKFEFEDSNY